jgi:sister-chromatid-cohesion protein PDS5
MPGRIRQATATAAADQQADVQYIPGLQFNESLTWRAGKAIPVADLLSRLQNLSQELKSLEQDQVDRTSFTRVAQDLASANLIGHKDKGIRAYTACCVVDILRLCAPDAPFKNAQLKVCINTKRESM